MARFTGKDLVMTWVPSTGGTITLNTDFQVCDFNPSGKLIDVTAGSDAAEKFLPTTTSGKVSYAGLLDDTSGTATEDALAPNTFGTLTIQPRGTATGRRKYICPAYSGGANITYPFEKAVSLKNDWQLDGAYTRTTN